MKLDHKDPQDHKDHQDLLVLKEMVWQVLQEIQVLLALQGCLVLVNKECQACQESLVIWDHQENKVNRDLVEQRDYQAFQDHLVPLDPRACQELGSQVAKGDQDCQDPKEKQGTKVYLVFRGCLVQKGIRELDILGHKVLKAYQGPQVHLGIKDCQGWASLEHLVCQEHQVNKGNLDRLDHLVQKVHQAWRANKDHKDCLALGNQVTVDCQVNQVSQVIKDYQGHQACQGRLDYLDLENQDTLAQRVTKEWGDHLVLQDQKVTKDM